jgi:hypothetical protein
MVRKLAALVACLMLSLPGCSKSVPGQSGTAAYKVKDPVWVTYGWSKGRMIYVIFFVPNSANAFNPEGVAATAKLDKDPKVGDTFEGAFDGYLEKSKSPFKAGTRTYEVTIEGKSYRTSNGPVFLVTVGTPSKVQQLQVAAIPGALKGEEDIPAFMETQVRKLVKETPKISEFPKEPEPVKPEKPKKK